jgi:simple sugar transport system permease protein
MTDLTERFVGRLRTERSLVRLLAFAIAVIVLFSISSDNFLTAINFQSMGFQVAEVGLLSLAVMLSMLTGGIDLSIVSVANIAALVAAQLFKSQHAATATSGKALAMTVAFVVVGLAAGTACGVVNGLIITRLRVTPILATLGTLQLFNGIAIIWTGGKAIYGMPNQFLNIGTGYLWRIPLPVIVLLGAAVGTAVFVNRTGIGLRLKLVGANPAAARYSGLNNDRVLMTTYIASAFLASMAGVVIAARSASANADYGTSYLLLTIVIVVLGGVSYKGGLGTVSGVVLAAFVLQFVSSGFNQVGFNNFLYNIAQGAILIGVMGLNSLSDRWGSAGGLAILGRRRRAEPKSTEPPTGRAAAGIAPSEAIPPDAIPPAELSRGEMSQEEGSPPAGGNR